MGEAKLYRGHHLIETKNFYLYTDDSKEAEFGEQLGFNMRVVENINEIEPSAIVNVNVGKIRRVITMEDLILTIYPSSTSSL